MAPKIVCINVFQGVGIEGQVELGEYSGDSTETRIKLRANEDLKMPTDTCSDVMTAVMNVMI